MKTKKLKKSEKLKKRRFKYHGITYFTDGAVLTAKQLNDSFNALLKKLLKK